MKIQNLAIIFIIIILPMSVILGAYINSQAKTLDLQTEYDTRLYNATYDAIKAFQLNTVNNTISDLANSKMRDLEAAANVFFSSIANNFNMSGYNSDDLKNYVPALVFTLYDGYYIYSPYTNTLTDTLIANPNSKYQDGQKISGFKPYIYYSARYRTSTIDVVITYSLDNYITIQGIINNKIVNDSGYLLDNVTYDDSTGVVKYRGIVIEKENMLKELIVVDNETPVEYEYVKTKGVKHYKDASGKWFTILNGEKIKENFKPPTDVVEGNKNCSAYNYYKEAALFKKRIQSYGLTDLKESDALEVSNLTGDNENVTHNFGNGDIFQFSNGASNIPDIEEPSSNFNQHRLAIIRYSIEKNLSIAIANYNNYSSGITTDFQMPRLKEGEWDRIVNNVTLISFLEGLNIGGKVYNGYSIVTNNKTEEFVDEDSIYIIANGEYHRITDEDLQNLPESAMKGELNTSFERKKMDVMDSAGVSQTIYYYPREETGCYSSIVTQMGTVDLDNSAYNNSIYRYLDKVKQDKGSDALSKVYYTALGRERYSMYRISPITTEQKLTDMGLAP